MRSCWLLVLAVACDRGASVDPSTYDRAEAARFGAEFAAAAMPCDEAKLGELVDHDAFAERATANLGAAGAVTRVQFDVRQTAVRIVCAWSEKASAYRLLHVSEREGQLRPLLRRIVKTERTGVAGVAYDELALRKGNDGKLRAIDVYSYMQGQWLSELLGEQLMAMRSSGGITTRLETVSTYQHAVDLGRDHHYAEALAALDELPEKLRASRGVMMMRVRFANGVSREAYGRELDAIAKAFPGDPSISLLEIDDAVLHHDYDAALRHVDAVDRVVGGDPFQRAVAAEILLKRKAAGDLEKARAAADLATSAEPTLAKGWWAEFDVAIAGRRYADAATVLARLERDFGVKVDAQKLRELPGYAEFVDSQEYSAMHAARP